MKVNVKYNKLKLSDLNFGDVFMVDGDEYEDVYMMTDNDYIDSSKVLDSDLVVIELDSGHLYAFDRNMFVKRANVAEINVEM